MRPAVLVFLLGIAVLAGSVLADPVLASGDGLDAVVELARRQGIEPGLVALDDYLAGHPGERRAHFLRASFLSQLDRSAEAKAELVQMVDQGDAAPEVFNNLAMIVAQDGDYDEAAEVLKAGLRSQTAFQVMYDNLNLVLGQLASRAYSRALGEEWLSEDAPRLAWIEDLASTVAVGQTLPVATAGLETQPAGNVQGATSAQNAAGHGVPLTDRPTLAGDEQSEVLQAVESWARAWTEQDADRYLSVYAASFVPPDGLSRREWEALRRARLAAPRFIEVNAVFEEPPVFVSDEVTVRFIQSYRSDVFSDTVIKTLRLKRESGWKITHEQTE